VRAGFFYTPYKGTDRNMLMLMLMLMLMPAQKQCRQVKGC
jgi:hypothetical protein